MPVGHGEPHHEPVGRWSRSESRPAPRAESNGPKGCPCEAHGSRAKDHVVEEVGEGEGR